MLREAKGGFLTPEMPPRLTPSGPSTGDFAEAGSAVRFRIASMEVWGLDLMACRAIPACKRMSRVPMHDGSDSNSVHGLRPPPARSGAAEPLV